MAIPDLIIRTKTFIQGLIIPGGRRGERHEWEVLTLRENLLVSRRGPGPLFSRFPPIVSFYTCICLSQLWPSLQWDMPKRVALVKPRCRAHHKSHTMVLVSEFVQPKFTESWGLKFSESVREALAWRRGRDRSADCLCYDQDSLLASLPMSSWQRWQLSSHRGNGLTLPSFYSHFQGQVW